MSTPAYETYRDGYLQALEDLSELLDAAIANGGGIDAGNGQFIENVHRDCEILDQVEHLKGAW